MITHCGKVYGMGGAAAVSRDFTCVSTQVHVVLFIESPAAALEGNDVAAPTAADGVLMLAGWTGLGLLMLLPLTAGEVDTLN